MHRYRDYFKANAHTIWAHGPLNPKPLWYPYRSLRGSLKGTPIWYMDRSSFHVRREQHQSSKLGRDLHDLVLPGFP